jgi:hypothetical protein
MLPVGTTTTGFGLLRANVEPYHKPKNISTIRMITVAVWTYSFFQSSLSFAFNALASICPMVLQWLCVLCFNSYRLEWEKLGRVKTTGRFLQQFTLKFSFCSELHGKNRDLLDSQTSRFLAASVCLLCLGVLPSSNSSLVLKHRFHI